MPRPPEPPVRSPEGQARDTLQGPFDQVARQRAIAWRVALDEHPCPVDARAHGPKAGSHPLRIALGVLEKLDRLVVASRERGEEPSNAVDRSGADLSRCEPHPVGVRGEPLLDVGRPPGITDQQCRLSQVGHPEQPTVVAGQECEPADRHLIHVAARLVDPPNRGIHVRRNGWQHPVAGVVSSQRMGELDNLVQTVLLAPQSDHRNSI